MTAITCPDDTRWSHFLLGELDPQEVILLELHLDECSPCRQRLAKWENNIDQSWLRLKELPTEADLALLQEKEFLKARESARSLLNDGEPGEFTRYRIAEPLGEGGFGEVFRAFDERLSRWVVLKVSRNCPDPCDTTFLDEARVVAQLEHPRIVPVYDAGRTPDGRDYIVFKTVDARSLRERMNEEPLDPVEAARVVRDVALVLQFAHARGVVHRDIKPSNILLDASGACYVADFGLALTEDRFGSGPRFAGTPEYMSPEQARGEGHRVDGRSDIFSLGAMFYELLAGRRPFFGLTREEILEQVASSEARPLRQWNDHIPRDLEAICLKALAPRMADRYATAKDLADELDAFLASQEATDSSSETYRPRPATGDTRQTPTRSGNASSSSELLNVVPKGLRPFSSDDAEFFIALLPGARDRRGEPESLRFWRSRIEPGAGESVAVGVLYGPSGCGKSSFVKAGLLPRLTSNVAREYIEATPDEFERVMLERIWARYPELAEATDLAAVLATVRQGAGPPRGSKLLLVIDQFEQFLHSRHDYASTPLAHALRQCDGRRVQALLLVRVDFWMPLKRFMDSLELSLREGENTAALDLFDKRHARRVLAAFGRAYEALPEGAISSQQAAFLGQAVEAMSEEGQVICVQLALFAQMMRNKLWTAETLAALGGIEGTGVAFLEDAFSARSAHPEARLHSAAARRVLARLLPEPGQNIKGSLRSRADLEGASEYPAGSRQFQELLRLLDSELRLITPATEVDRQVAPPDAAPLYQLTHDYLVEPLRNWLTQKQRETRRGRAKLLSLELASLWRRHPARRHLPSLGEWLSLCIFARGERSIEERNMLRAANRRYAPQVAVFLLAIVGAVYGLLAWRTSHVAAEMSQSLQLALLAPMDETEAAIEKLQKHKHRVIPRLRQIVEDPNSPYRVRAAILLGELGQRQDEWIYNHVGKAAPDDIPYVALGFRGIDDQGKDQLLKKIKSSDDVVLSVRLSSILWELGDARGVEHCLALRPERELRTQFIHDFASLNPTLDDLPAWARQASPAIQSGLCVALGHLERHRVLKAGEIRELVRQWRESEDAGLHSAAEWTLFHWNESVPPQSEATHRGWFVNKLGMTLARIDPGGFDFGGGDKFFPVDSEARSNDNMLKFTPRRVSISYSFYMAAHETQVQVYRQFLQKTEAWPTSGTTKPQTNEHSRDINDIASVLPPDKFPHDRSPAGMVSWFDAVAFCNWLSEQENREPCYTLPGPAPDYVKDASLWTQVQCNYDANGYRLPTDAEWEYCCRAGAASEFHFGNVLARAPDYAVYNVANCMRCGTVAPNPWGLFDMHGNLMEWCNDWAAPRTEDRDPRGPESPPEGAAPAKLLRGGYFGLANAYWLSGVLSQKHTMLDVSQDIFGFRVVCLTPPREAARN
jgi:serine/threonine protein kinase/formylglycine-generating enzyme required for sulfatase activity